jgi:phosphoribosyl 1,2-cyclic phosphate phosphodiesterase
MKIRILGTAAAEGIPAIACDCETCIVARERGGKNIRARSGALIDDVLKIDFGPDTLYHIHRDRLDPTLWKWIIFTHSHHDHCAHEEFQYLLPGFAPPKISENLHLYGNLHVQEKVAQVKHYGGLQLTAEPLKAFEPLVLDPYKILPVLANHTDGEECHNFIVERGDKRLLYACDTGWYPEETWDFLQGMHMNLLVLEATKALTEASYTKHLSIKECVDFCHRLREQGTLSSRSRVILTHFSHNGDALQEEMEVRAHPEGMEIAYDGIVIEV